jgi:hypothetical protein
VTTINQNAREMIARRVRALLAKTTEAGCTEAEAMAAAEMAKALMDKYSISQTEAEIEAEGTKQGTSERVRAGRVIISDYLSQAVSRFCDCKAWQQGKYDLYGRRVSSHVFLGGVADVDFATWLLKSLADFVKVETGKFIHGGGALSGGRRAELFQSFSIGCASRIAQRLNALTSDRKIKAEVMSDGRALVVVKGAIVDRAFAATGIKLRSGSRKSAGVGSSGAYNAGRAAGDRASFGRPVNGGSGTRLLS